ncbi:MAG: hypothetical protein KAU16_07225 [Methanophagales archaeon]|nr:hypothetical protein [Methanophagales archaeon]
MGGEMIVNFLELIKAERDIIARTSEPILEPEEDYEREGDVPNVVFPEGAVVMDDKLVVFYGAADKVCCAASISLSKFVYHLLREEMI